MLARAQRKRYHGCPEPRKRRAASAVPDLRKTPAEYEQRLMGTALGEPGVTMNCRYCRLRTLKTNIVAIAAAVGCTALRGLCRRATTCTAPSRTTYRPEPPRPYASATRSGCPKPDRAAGSQTEIRVPAAPVRNIRNGSRAPVRSFHRDAGEAGASADRRSPARSQAGPARSTQPRFQCRRSARPPRRRPRE